MRGLVAKIVVVLVICMLSNLAYAGTTGKIVGTIKDKDTGEPLIGANVVLEGTGMGASTDTDGFFMIINVPPGTYTLTVYYVGYATVQIEGVQVSVDRTTTKNVQMSVQVIEGETVVVQAERPTIEMDRTHTAAVVTAETVELMPVTEMEEILELQAGVVKTGGQLHFRGGRTREVSYVVDGIPVNNTYSQSGGSLVEVDNNMIEELEVISGTFNAEYGQAQSGVVNIVTKRPATEFRTSVNAYLGDWFSSKDHIFLGVDNFNPLAEGNVEIGVTGPIIRNKLGFVVNGRVRHFESLDWYERRFNTVDGWKIAAYREWAQFNQVSSSTVIPIPDSLATGDRSRGPLRTSDYGSFQAKLVYSLTPEISITGTAFGSLQETRGPLDGLDQGADQFYRYAPDDYGTYKEWSYSFFLRFQHSPSDKFFYNLAFSYQREDADFFYRKDNKIARFPGDDGIQLFSAASTGVTSGNTFSLGGTSSLYTGKPGEGYNDQYLIQGDFNWQVDKHNFVKTGFSVKQNYIDVYQRGFRFTQTWLNNDWPVRGTPVIIDGEIVPIDPAQMTFDEYWTALQVYWRNWEARFRDNRVEEVGPEEVALYRDYQIKPLEIAAYIQDKLELSNEIIINVGLRLDVFQPNEKVPINFRAESFNLGSDINLRDAEVKYQFSPRVGISFPISSNGAFHGSYGHFFQMPPYSRMYNEPLVTMTRFQLEGRRLGNADLEPERTVAYEIGLQQAITSDIAVDITAYYKDFRNLLGIEQITTTDLVTYTRYINRDYGYSKGITVDITKRRGMVTGGINYTLSFANGSASDPAALYLIQTAIRVGGESDVFPERKILSLDWDQRHTVNAYLNFVKANNWSIGFVGYLNSGNPFSPAFLERFDLNQREFRNTAFKPTQWNVDLKLKKHLTLAGLKSAIYLKIDNLFDHLNHEQVFSVSGQADEIAKLPELEERDNLTVKTEGLFTNEEIYTFPDYFSRPRKIQFGLEFQF
ncbi:MAG: hypothetical protein Kow0042_07850 [Calditrichia bacterium]